MNTDYANACRPNAKTRWVKGDHSMDHHWSHYSDSPPDCSHPRCGLLCDKAIRASRKPVSNHVLERKSA